jgi:hypothetical protein
MLKNIMFDIGNVLLKFKLQEYLTVRTPDRHYTSKLYE